MKLYVDVNLLKITALYAALCIAALVTSHTALASPARTAPLVGVIRWDGYNGSPAITQKQEFGFLKPAQHHWRAPWFVKLTGDPEKPLSFNPEYKQSEIQKVTNQEIRYAADAGIDYWAFCHFLKSKGDGWQLRNNLQAYLDSPLKKRIGFSLICLGGHIGAGLPTSGPDTTWSDWRNYVAEYISLMKDPTYQKVLGNRPLFYIMGPDELSEKLGDKDYKIDQLKLAILYLRQQVQSAGLGNPYIVGMNAGGIWAARYIDEAGLDAISAYRGAFGSSKEGAPYSSLWENIKKLFLDNGDMGGGTRKVVVPLLSGVDDRPRNAQSLWYREPKPGEIGKLLTNAFEFIKANPAKCEANSVLIYAWNEHSEGGFLCPILGPGLNPNKPDCSRLNDLGAAIKAWRKRK